MNSCIKALVLTPYVPYENMRHAGGKIHNYIVKEILERKNEIELTVFGTGFWYEKNKITIDKKVASRIKYLTPFDQIVRKLYEKIIYKNNVTSKWGIFGHPYYRSHFIRHIKKFKKNGYVPDVVFLEWTEVGLLIDDVKRYFPNAKYIITESDVAYLAAERKLNAYAGKNKEIFQKKYETAKKAELAALSKANLVVCNNQKDRNLLITDNIDPEKIVHIIPYFDSLLHITPKYEKPNLLIWGAMRRPENYEGAIWFIKKIWPSIQDQFPDSILFIVGLKPPDMLKKLYSEKIVVTGYVDDVTSYFENASVFVAPLLTGAGIKIKIIEAMSAGLPVVTNSIGIEGIPAENNSEYIFAQSEEEFVAAITSLLKNTEQARRIGSAAKKFIHDKFNYQSSINKYIDKVIELCATNERS